jgi:hypothetical protein
MSTKYPRYCVQDMKDGILVGLTPGTKPVVTDLFEAIPKRQVSRCEYDGKPLSSTELDQLKEAGTGNGVKALIITDRDEMDNVKFSLQRRTWILGSL